MPPWEQQGTRSEANPRRASSSRCPRRECGIDSSIVAGRVYCIKVELTCTDISCAKTASYHEAGGMGSHGEARLVILQCIPEAPLGAERKHPAVCTEAPTTTPTLAARGC